MEILSLRERSSINAIAASPDNQLALCGGRDVLKLIKLGSKLEEDLTLRTGRTKMIYATHDIVWHPKHQNYILSTSLTSCIVLWNLDKRDNRLEQTFRGHGGKANSVNWHPTEDDVFISAGGDGLIKIWDRRDPSTCDTIQGGAEAARNASFSPHSEWTFAGCFDNGEIKIWDRRRMTSPKLQITAHHRNALCIHWSPDQPSLLVSGGSDRTIKIWNTETGQNVKKIQAPESVYRVRWDILNNKQIASISHANDKNMYIWNIEEPWLPTQVFKGHTALVTDFLIFPDHVITCSADGNVIRQPRCNAYNPRSLINKTCVGVSPLNVLATSSYDKKSHLKYFHLGDIRKEIEMNAKGYKLEGDSIPATCIENSLVNPKHAGLWQTISSLYKTKQNTDINWVKETVEDTFNKTIEYYAEIGDMQTAACVSSVLSINGPISEYENLLRQLRINISATKLGLVHKNLDIFTKCKCGKDSEEHPEGNCDGIAYCAVCNNPVKGLYSWCQGCGHGGHIAHIQNWFAQNTKCPAGCGHVCIP